MAVRLNFECPLEVRRRTEPLSKPTSIIAHVDASGAPDTVTSTGFTEQQPTPAFVNCSTNPYPGTHKVFQVHAVDENGEIVAAPNLTRGRLVLVLAEVAARCQSEAWPTVYAFAGARWNQAKAKRTRATISEPSAWVT